MPNYTSPLRILQTDFRAGELDPLIYMRVDSKIYPSGAKSLENMLVYNTGAASRRPGMGNLNTITKKCRLMPFEFDTDEKYVFAFGDNYLGIYAPDGTLDDSFTGTTDCPWDADEAWELTTEQAGDVMFIFHENHQPKVCTRTGATTFTMADFEFEVDSEAFPLLKCTFTSIRQYSVSTMSVCSAPLTLTQAVKYSTISIGF